MYLVRKHGPTLSGAFDPRWQDHDVGLEIDLAALAHNVCVLRGVTPKSAELGVVVKADGYGLVMAARIAASVGAGRLIVATISEGLAIREAGLTLPVLVVYPVPAPAIATAARAGTIPNEILPSLGPRPPLVHVDGGRVVARSRRVTHLAFSDGEIRGDDAQPARPRS